jgi:NAD(P)-dependent dehydrogenase (short-subunit alcohol dehydrogenase family)
MPAQNLGGFSEKVALVTDGASAVGRAVALQLALQGCYVIAGYSNADEKTKRALAELKSLGTLANAFESDCTTVSGARALVQEVENIYGRLDLLINTLKFEPQSSFIDISEDAWQQSIDANLKAMFFVTQAAVPLMKPRPKPVIVSVASACDTDETSRNVAFAGAQAGIVGMTKSLALELAPKFRVNCVAVSEKKIVSEALDPVLFPPKTGVASDDVARTIVYLLSSEAVGLTGQILTVGKG